jgi:hypothetical protein
MLVIYMTRERIILSDLDLKILEYLKEEKNVTELLNKCDFGFSQCKRHLKRLKKYINKRNYGTFRFFKINSEGERVLEVLK